MASARQRLENDATFGTPGRTWLWNVWIGGWIWWKGTWIYFLQPIIDGTVIGISRQNRAKTSPHISRKLSVSQSFISKSVGHHCCVEAIFMTEQQPNYSHELWPLCRNFDNSTRWFRRGQKIRTSWGMDAGEGGERSGSRLFILCNLEDWFSEINGDKKDVTYFNSMIWFASALLRYLCAQFSFGYLQDGSVCFTTGHHLPPRKAN